MGSPPNRTADVAAVEGAMVLSRAERHPGPLLEVAAELEDVIAGALP